MFETIITSIISFAGTNIDDLFINTLFYAEAASHFDHLRIFLGRILGIGFLVLLSILGALGLHIIPPQYIRFLGLVPLVLGMKEFIVYFSNRNNEDDDSNIDYKNTRNLLLHVVLITIANGADNISVYIPLFADYSAVQLMTVIIIFAVMAALWCLLSQKLSDLPLINKFLILHKSKIIPFVFIILGIYILARN